MRKAITAIVALAYSHVEVFLTALNSQLVLLLALC